MRKKTRLAVIGAAFAVVGSGISIPFAGSASASSGPSVTVVNMAGSSLADGGAAVVTGSGFPSHSADPSGLEVIECSDPGGSPANLPTDPSLGCDGSTVSANQINTSPSGSFSTTYAVSSLSASGNSDINCDATDYCVLWVGEDYNNQFSDGVTEAFSAPFLVVPAVAPSITSASSAAFPAFSTSTFTVVSHGIDTPTVSESGAIPAGVTFTANSNGTATLTGKPTTTGTFPLTFTASNGTTPNFTQSFTLYAGFRVTTTSLPPATIGSAYTSPSLNVAGGTAPYKYKVKGLPKGLKASKSTGVITGTVVASKKVHAGTFTVTVTVTDSKVKTSTKHPNPNGHGKETATATLHLTLLS